MIATLKGVIQSRDTQGIVLDVGGVGYALTMSARSLDALGQAGESAFVYTYLHVREDALSLFGFATAGERDFFEHLKSVSGVGPKVAIAVLSAYAPEELSRAVAGGDVALFQSISGIGKKTAERLVLELKDKVEAPVAAAVAGNGSYQLAREALVSLGYSFAEAEAALGGVDLSADAGEIIRQALKRVGAVKA